jgi:hypothetical protein
MIMKKILLITILATLGFTAKAQIEISPYAGYTFGGVTAYSYNGYRLRIDGSANYGLSLGFMTPADVQIELSYNHTASTLRQDGGLIEVIKPQPINVNYIQVGALKPFNSTEKLVPYGLFTLGASQYNPTDQIEDYWRFAINLGLGVKYFVSDMIGLRFQTKLYMPLYFAGVGFGCGIGTGGASCGGGAGFGAEIVQLDITGGLIIRIDN